MIHLIQYIAFASFSLTHPVSVTDYPPLKVTVVLEPFTAHKVQRWVHTLDTFIAGIRINLDVFPRSSAAAFHTFHVSGKGIKKKKKKQ